MSYQQFFKILQEAAHDAPTTDDRVLLQNCGAQIAVDFAKLNLAQRQKLVSTIHALSKPVATETRVFLFSLLFNLTGEETYLNQTLAEYEKIQSSPVDYINDYFTLSNLAFHSLELKQENIINQDLLRENYRKAVDGLIEQFPLKKPVIPHESRIVVLVDQLLGKKHAPTNRALKLVQVLQETFHKEVLLVNTCMFSRVNSGYIARKNRASVAVELSQSNREVIDGSIVNRFQPDPPELNEDTVRSVIEKIAEFGPSGILVVGNQCALAEVFANDCFTLCSPLNNDVVPECIGVNFHTHTQGLVGNTQLGGLERRKSKPPLFQFEGPYDIPEKKGPLSRQDLNLPDNRPVLVVVGHRLNFDIDDAFLDMLEDVTSKSNAFVYFVGGYENHGQLGQRWPSLAKNSIESTFQVDLMSVYENCDLYLAPTRIGGGSSAVYAMAAGLPVLSLSIGDVRITTQHFPELKAYEEIGDVVLNIINCPEKMAEYRTMAKQGAKAVMDSKALVAEFLNHKDQFEKSRAAVQ